MFTVGSCFRGTHLCYCHTMEIKCMAEDAHKVHTISGVCTTHRHNRHIWHELLWVFCALSIVRCSKFTCCRGFYAACMEIVEEKCTNFLYFFVLQFDLNEKAYNVWTFCSRSVALNLYHVSNVNGSNKDTINDFIWKMKLMNEKSWL